MQAPSLPYFNTSYPSEKHLPSIRHIHYFTDSPTSQYRNVSITTMLLKHESMFHIIADWLYFEAGHGKGPFDGVGGVSKRHARVVINRKHVTVIDCAEDYFKLAQEDITSKIRYCLESGNDVLDAKGQKDGWQQHRVPSIMNVHSIIVKGPYLYVRDKSCYKRCCYDANTNTFLGKCDGWMKTTAKRQTRLNPKAQSRTCGGGRGQMSARKH